MSSGPLVGFLFIVFLAVIGHGVDYVYTRIRGDGGHQHTGHTLAPHDYWAEHCPHGMKAQPPLCTGGGQPTAIVTHDHRGVPRCVSYSCPNV